MGRSQGAGPERVGNLLDGIGHDTPLDTECGLPLNRAQRNPRLVERIPDPPVTPIDVARILHRAFRLRERWPVNDMHRHDLLEVPPLLAARIENRMEGSLGVGLL